MNFSLSLLAFLRDGVLQMPENRNGLLNLSPVKIKFVDGRMVPSEKLLI